MANFEGSFVCCTSKKSVWHIGSIRWLKKIFIFLILLVSIGLYIPAFMSSLKNYTQAFSSHDIKGFKLFQRISKKYIAQKSPGVNFSWLETNPVYSQFQIKEAKHKKSVTVLIIVSSAPRRVDRRQAIRETWWKQCKKTNKVIPECIFATDYQNKSDPFYHMLELESRINRDIYFQHAQGGIAFGLRMLNHMVLALSHYDFDYFLRMDDDYFFCMDHVLREIPLPMVTNFHWGWLHCVTGITRPEESLIMFSRDVIQRFIQQDPNKILCHPWADQMIGAWSNEMDMTYLFRHDDRIHHIPVVSKQPSLRYLFNICNIYISVHGTYPNDMRRFWRQSTKEIDLQTEPRKTLLDKSVVCPITAPFNWQNFSETWSYEPKLCIKNPTWDTSKQFVIGGAYSGREDENKQYL